MKTVTEFVDSLAPRSPLAFGALHKEVTARDAEHRAELAAAQATIEQLGKDGAAMATENERIKGELGEARSIVYDLVLYAQKAPGAARTCHRARVFLAAPPPAESTPVPASRETPVRCVKCMGTKIDRKGRECRYCSWKPQPAPPDDIRLEESLINRIAEAKSYVLGQVGRVERVFAAHSEEAYRRLADHERRLAALEAKDSDRCARADCGRPRRWGGHEGHHEFVAALEAKGEPGTHADDICARPKCLSPRHYNIHDPERGGHVFVDPKGAKP